MYSDRPPAVAVQEEEGQYSDQGSVETLYNINDRVERKQALLKLHSHAMVM